MDKTIQYEKHYEINAQILYDSTQREVTRRVKTQERESGKVVSRGLRQRKGELWSDEDGASVREDEEIPEMDGGDRCTAR